MSNMMFRSIWRLGWACALVSLLFFNCENPMPQGLMKTPAGKGPVIMFDLEARPLPEIPLPNDLATRLADGSSTKRYVNVSMIAPTGLEEEVRHKVNNLTGFGIYAPISVRFSSRLDLQDIINRHQKNNNFKDDAVYLVNLNPKSKNYGKPVLLDFGRGNFPFVLEKTANYFDYDPHAGQSNLAFETREEKDLNGNGKLDPEEDLDHDGVWDKPNVFPPGSDPHKNLLSFYELETETLLIQPVIPLEPSSTYAVILTSRLKDTKGQPVRSPFAFINHTRQTKALQPILQGDLLKKLGITSKEIAFAWTFSTQNTTQDLKDIRDGLYGHGPFQKLATMYPATMDKLHPMVDSGEKAWMVTGAKLRKELGAKQIASLVFGSNLSKQKALIDTFLYIDYIVAGSFKTPFFLAPRDWEGNVVKRGQEKEVLARAAECRKDAEKVKAGKCPKIGKEIIFDAQTTFQLDRNTGKMVVGHDDVTWWCAVPKKTAKFKPPFPVAFYGHGYTSSRFEMMGFAGNFAKLGIALCAIDAVGHGASLSPSETAILEAILGTGGLLSTFRSLSPGRARDLNNDGHEDSGGDFWTADTFHTRDVVRQSVLDHIQMIRIMRSWDGKRKWNLPASTDGKTKISGIAGDFNGDGIVDFGGPLKAAPAGSKEKPAQDYHTWGQSLGGILSAILAGIEPTITAAAPVAGGGGLIQLGARSMQGGVAEAVFLRMMGPIIVGYGRPDGSTDIRYWVPDVNKKACSNDKGTIPAERLSHCLFAKKDRIYGVRFAVSQKIKQGDMIVVENLRSKETSWAIVRYDKAAKRHYFRFSIAADALDSQEKRLLLGIPLDPAKLKVENYRFPEIQPVKGSEDKIKAVSFPDGNEKSNEIGLLGDKLVITVYRRDGDCANKNRAKECIREVINKTSSDVYFQGAVYRAGLPLFAFSKGLGQRRQTPEFRRFLGFAGMMLEPGDPISYAPHYHLNPISYTYERNVQPGANVLVVPTIGDMNVPIDTGIAIARAAGIIPILTPDERYKDPKNPGKFLTANQVLIQNYVVEGLERLKRFTHGKSGAGIHLDPDNLSRGTDSFGAPRLNPPLRLTHKTSIGVAGMRIPYVSARGDHGFDTPTPDAKFDIDTFMVHQIALYFQTNGKVLRDDFCMAKGDCKDIPQTPPK